MAFIVRPCSNQGEFLEAFMAIGQYFGAEPTPERVERFLKVLELERMHAAFEDGTIVGGAGAFTFDMTVPGGPVPTAGVTVVGVSPTHRRRGVLRSMMRAQLDDVRRRGEPLAALWASEETIYGRYGYGMASLTGSFELPRAYAQFARPHEPGGRVRIVSREEALELLPRVYDSVRTVTPGMLSRSRAWWEFRIVADPPERREGGGPKRFAVLDLDGRPQGYAVYRHNAGFEHGISTAKLGVIEVVAADGAATAGIWRYLLDIDWQAAIVSGLLPVDHPLFLLLANPRRMGFHVTDALWVRIMDVEAALAARAYAADGALVFDLADDFAPWNQGRFRLAGGRAERTGEEPDLRLDIQALGSVYLGGFSFGDLARAGRVSELRPGALSRADAMFRVDRRPWCPEIF